MRVLLALIFLSRVAVVSAGDVPNLHLFVALADNVHQRIARVPANGEKASEIRERAAVSYARNQKISIKAARGVFSSREK